MRKGLLFALLLSSNLVFAQLLTFNFDAATGTTATAPSSSNATGVAPSVITRGTGLTPQTGTGQFNSSGFATSSTIDVNDYIEFVLSPVTGYRINPASVSVVGVRSNPGPTSFVIRTSLDNFAANATNIVTISTTSVSNAQFVFTQPVSITTAITIRLYGYNANNANGTFAIGGQAGTDLTVNGPAAIVLPVKFAYVTATKNPQGIDLSFSNLTESDVIDYAVERSANGQQYTSIKQIAPVKNNGGKSDYRYTDPNPLSGINYYRVKAVEENGKISYSTAVKLNLGFVKGDITIYSNPIKNSQLSFQVTNLEKGSYKVIVLNTVGQIIDNQSIRHEGGSFSQTLLMPNLKKGVYYLQLQGLQQLKKAFVVE